ncbi:MAG: AMMECR1 domain-containing protein, partial [Planctomycetes bacterium]|nr:AMMECR1 domain-containing protein [Planctomycetota bacterium]
MAIRHILTKVGVEKTAIVFLLAVCLMFTAFGCRRSKMNPRAEKNGDVSPNTEENESNVHDEAEGKSARNENNEKKGNCMLSEKDREELLRIAREAVEAAVAGKQVPKEKIENENLQGKQGAFVTLKTNGNLRGCIGRFTADQPLWKTVREMAVSAATQDPRFRGHRI